MKEKIQVNLSKKDKNNRLFILEGNMWMVVLRLGIPLALFQSMTHLFKIVDTKMAAHISSSAVSAVAYLSQINLMISAVGGGLAIGASLKISEAYGSGDYELVKKRVSSLYALCAIVSGIILISIVPFAESFLELVKTPKELIYIGKRYFLIELCSMVIMFINGIYIAVERARGNTKRILYLNIGIICIKLVVTSIFIYIFNWDVTSIAVATLISQVILLIVAIKNMSLKNDVFGFSVKAIRFDRFVTTPMIRLSIPVIIERIAFAFGKVIINAMSAVYGALTVGALAVSNNIGGVTTAPQNGFLEGGAAIISQNLGAGNTKRAISAFWKVLIINVTIGAMGFISTMVFLDSISAIFAEEDIVFQQMIIHIYRFEAFGAITLGINSAVLALLYGFGYTKWTLLINFMRVFVFRIPVLWMLQHFTELGSESVGIVMMVSNISIGIVAAVIGLFTILKIKRKEKGEKNEKEKTNNCFLTCNCNDSFTGSLWRKNERTKR